MKANGRKRLFLGLIIISLLLLTLVVALVWYLFRTGAPLGRALWVLMMVLAIGFVLYALGGTLSLVISLISGHNISILSRAREQVAYAFLPLALRVGSLLGLEKDRIRASFVQVNNQLVSQGRTKVEANELLILAPVCLQEAACVRKVTHDINQCRRCGRCPVGDLLSLADKYEVHAAIATGGTKARQLIQDIRPKVVVAIACERDLVSGLQDSRPIAVKGIANERPNGPCFNTRIDLEEVEAAIVDFLFEKRGGSGENLYQ